MNKEEYKNEILTILDGDLVNINHIKIAFGLVGSELLISDYMSHEQDLPFRCKCRRLDQTRWRNVIRGHVPICKICSGQTVDIAFVKKFFESFGVEPLFDEYKNNEQDLLFLCKCGSKGITKWKYLKNLKSLKCSKCKGKKFLTTEMVKKAFLDVGGEPLFDEYLRKPHEKLPFRCSCGNEHELPYSKISSGRKARCPDCGQREGIEIIRGRWGKRFGKLVRQVFIDHGLTPLFDEYKNAKTLLNFLCSCGNKCSISWGNFHRDIKRDAGVFCSNCSSNAPPSDEQLASAFKKSGSVQLGEYERSDVPILFRCECGNFHSIRWSQLRSGTLAYCPQCQHLNRPRGENHPFWNPNKTDEERTNQNRGLAFKKWSGVVLASNSYSCITGNDLYDSDGLVAHHLNGWSGFPDQRYIINNGVSLSKEYHKEYHNSIGWHNPSTVESFRCWYFKRFGTEFTNHLDSGVVFEVLDDPDTNLLETKRGWCEKTGVSNYIPFFLPELTKSFSAVVSMIRYRGDFRLETIGSRKLNIAEIDTTRAFKFLNKSHIQGSVGSNFYFGLTDGDEIYALMTWIERGDEWVLSRFSINPGYSVPGAASRLFNHSLSVINPIKIVSYADRRFSKLDPMDSLYVRLGFEYSHSSDPSYWYSLTRTDIQNRRTFQRKNLINKLPDFRPELSERENMDLAGYTRYDDCGTFVYKYGG